MTTPLLQIEDIEVVYSDGVLALGGVSLTIPEGSIVALLGSNGAGKSSTMKAISGLLAAEQGRVRAGRILFRGKPIHHKPPSETVGLGIAHVLEGRRLFKQLTVDENLRMGAYARRDIREIDRDLDRVYEMFPRLAERKRGMAGFLSGGEQQMTAIGRGIMARPLLMLLDEPTMGLAPAVAEEVFAAVKLLRDSGISFLVSEQNLALALKVADSKYVLQNGRMSQAAPSGEMSGANLKSAYFG